MEKIHEFVFKSDIENITTVENFIERLKCNFEIEEDVFGNMMVSTVEAVTNAITHGNAHDSSKMVSFEAFKRPDAFVFRVKDEGEGFNPFEIPDPTQPENLECPNGRGVFLIKHLADRVEFLDNGNTVEMEFYI